MNFYRNKKTIYMLTLVVAYRIFKDLGSSVDGFRWIIPSILFYVTTFFVFLFFNLQKEHDLLWYIEPIILNCIYFFVQLIDYYFFDFAEIIGYSKIQVIYNYIVIIEWLITITLLFVVFIRNRKRQPTVLCVDEN